MARLDLNQLLKELKEKNLTLDSESPEYKNISSEIYVVCDKGHKIEANLKTIRAENFRCPVCDGLNSKGFKHSANSVIPIKKGYRIIGIDNATQKFGVSIFENGNLIYYNVLTFEGDLIDRLNGIWNMINDVIIPMWEPDYIQFEDVQLQDVAFKIYNPLNALTFLIEMSCKRFGLPCEKTRSNIWRSHFLINGGGRPAEKAKAIKKVQNMYQINVSDDVAEAILIGKYRVDLKAKKERKDLF